VDLNVEPYKKNDGKIQYFIGEDGLGLPYKSINQIES
jgi:hypothetical protein